MSITQNLQNLQQELAATNSKTIPQIIAVSKTISIDKILELYNNAAQTQFAENYVQEFVTKVNALHNYPELQWHFIGHLQSNKTKLIAQYASWVHSLENKKQVIRLDKDRPSTSAKLNCLIQINLSQDQNKHGIDINDLTSLIDIAKLIVNSKNLVFRGIMGVASQTNNINKIDKEFKQLRTIFEQLVNMGFKIDHISMGMSHDYKIAIKNGTTMLRIGSAIFGKREY